MRIGFLEMTTSPLLSWILRGNTPVAARGSTIRATRGDLASPTTGGAGVVERPMGGAAHPNPIEKSTAIQYALTSSD
jgi:hypothetical protein